MNRLILLTVTALLIACSSMAQDAAVEQPVQDIESEASNFVIGLSALNNQLITALGEQPTNRVIILPFPDMAGRYSRVSQFFREQMVTAIAATRSYQILPNDQLIDIVQRSGMSPMDLASMEQFQQVQAQYANDSIIVGTITNLDKKIAVMARIIQGVNGSYAGAAMVYIRVSDEIAALMGEEMPGMLQPEPEEPVADEEVEAEPPVILTPVEDSKPETKPEETEPEQINIPIPDVDNQSDTAIYRIARDLFVGGKYSESIGYFQQLLANHPESHLADNAVYWIGEAYYALKSWENARVEFQKVLDQYPYGNKVPSATLKRGYCEEKLGRTAAAVDSMEEVIMRFSDSPEAELAKGRLQLLRAEQQ